MALPKCRSCGYELTMASTAAESGLAYDWGHEADCLARKLASTESKLEAVTKQRDDYEARGIEHIKIAGDLDEKLDAIRDVIYEQFSKGRASSLVALGRIEKLVKEPQ
jgi:hypothetical protein